MHLKISFAKSQPFNLGLNVSEGNDADIMVSWFIMCVVKCRLIKLTRQRGWVLEIKILLNHLLYEECSEVPIYNRNCVRTQFGKYVLPYHEIAENTVYIAINLPFSGFACFQGSLFRLYSPQTTKWQTVDQTFHGQQVVVSRVANYPVSYVICYVRW